MTDGCERFDVLRYADGAARKDEIEVVREVPCALYVNRFELVAWMCTPLLVERLALGFLLNERIIEAPAEIASLRVREGEGGRLFVDVELAREDVPLPRRRVLTSGCTGGVTFEEIAAREERVESPRVFEADAICEALGALLDAAVTYKRSRGVHTSALADPPRLVAIAEDVGRHNTLDKLRGIAAADGIETAGLAVLSTGRISSEMLGKAARMRCPLVASRTSPTSLSVRLARAWGVTVLGYVRPSGGSFNVYAGEQRVAFGEERPKTS